MISISLSILLLNLCVQTCSSNTTTVASDYYVAPEGEVNYDENVVTSITAKYNKNVRPIETVGLTLKVNFLPFYLCLYTFINTTLRSYQFILLFKQFDNLFIIKDVNETNSFTR